MKKLLSTLLLILLSATSNMMAQETFKFGTNVNPEGVRFEVDSRGFIIDGQRVLPVMGEIHYSRVPQTEWRREVQKMRAGGVTIVATYVFWNHHEAEEGRWDWSGNRNLRRFLEICRDEQMPVVLRIGPFCHGEVWQGGFPDWLTAKSAADSKHFKLRSTAKGFMDAARNLYNNIFAQVNGLLWKQGGTVVGVQIENESRGPWPYLEALKKTAVEAGFDTPFYTRTGWPKLNGKEVFGQLLPLYGDYADGFWDRKLTDMPGDYPKAFIMKDTRLSAVIATEALGTNQSTKMEGKDLSYPYLTCELGGGMMPAYHRRINMNGREVKPLAVCKLGSGSNLPGYYMYHGGTNPYSPRHTMAETQASPVTNYNDMPHMTYDFQAILGEMGQPNAVSWNESRLLHEFLKEWGGELSLMDVDTLSDHYARRGAFEFRNDYVRILNEGGRATITPRDWQIADGVTVDWATAEPYCKADGTVYFIVIDGQKPRVSINGKTYSAKPDKPFTAAGMTFCVLSKAKANTSYKINGKLYFSDGLLYQDGDRIVEEKWQVLTTPVAFTKIRDSKGLRTVAMGTQKVAAAPVDADFENAAIWEINGPLGRRTLARQEWSMVNGQSPDDLFLQINYRGDVARVYADGQLVEDNYWNGKPMLVRMSDLVGKRVELRILPLGKDFPIYLQREQRAQLDAAPDGQLLSLDSIKVIERTTQVKQ